MQLPMPAAVFAVLVVLFVVVGVYVIRRKQGGAFVDRLPVEDGEAILLEEAGLKVYRRAFRTSARGGATITHRVRAVLTDRRIILATGGPAGKHKFVILMILDYTTPAHPVLESGYAAYLEKFRLENGYPTYAFSAEDVRVEGEGSDAALRIDVPFPEGGPGWGDPPEVKIYTAQIERYRDAVSRR